jgi:hypothetical protein
VAKQAFVERKFWQGHRKKMVDIANGIVENLYNQGYNITVRMLYYQMVSQDIIPNNLKECKKLAQLVNDARLAGLIDWDHIIDMTRNLRAVATWLNAASIVQGAAGQFKLDKWADQEYRVECWVEKEAMLSVVARGCSQYQVPYFACKGYTSQSEMYEAAKRLQGYMDSEQQPVILYLGDHDHSGVDMSRDIFQRLEMFMGGVTVKRLALNMDQVEKYKLPPNPAKFSDSRVQGYIKKYGKKGWELDALVAISPQVVVSMIEKSTRRFMDLKKWEDSLRREQREGAVLHKIVEEWPAVAEAFADAEVDKALANRKRRK